MSMYSYCRFMYLHRASWHSSATLIEGFPCFFLSCKTNARVKHPKTGHGPHSSKMFVLIYVLFVFVSFCVLFVCKCVLYYCHRVAGYPIAVNKIYHIISVSNNNTSDFPLIFLLPY